MKRLFLLLLLLLSTINVGAEEERVLDLFLGKWKTEVVITKDGNRFQASGLGEGRRILEGEYVEFRGHSIPPGDSDLQIMTKTETGYSQWLYDSSGYRHQAEGTWDPVARVLRWKGKLPGGSFVIDDKFVGADRLEWSLVHRDDSGQIVREIEGVLTRVDQQEG